MTGLAQRKQGAVFDGARVLQIRAGGVGSAIAIALLDTGARELVIHDRDPARLADLVSLLPKRGRGAVCEGPSDRSGFDVVVNATPMKMSPKDPVPLSC